MNGSTIVIKGNVNINVSLNPLDIAAQVDGDDLTSQNLTALIASIFNGGNSDNSSYASDESSQDCCAKEKCDKPRKWNINAPEFIPTKHIIVDDDSDYENDSDYVPESDEESEAFESDSEDEIDADKLDLFKNICKTKKIPYSLALFKKYDVWSESNGKGLNRYAKMGKFLDNNKVIQDTSAKVKNNIASEQRKQPAIATHERVGIIQNAINTLKEPAKTVPAPVKKRDQAKVDLLQDICEKFDVDYTNALFDEYEEWSKTNAACLNRYKKMSQFLYEKTNNKSENADRA